MKPGWCGFIERNVKFQGRSVARTAIVKVHNPTSIGLRLDRVGVGNASVPTVWITEGINPSQRDGPPIRITIGIPRLGIKGAATSFLDETSPFGAGNARARGIIWVAAAGHHPNFSGERSAGCIQIAAVIRDQDVAAIIIPIRSAPEAGGCVPIAGDSSGRPGEKSHLAAMTVSI